MKKLFFGVIIMAVMAIMIDTLISRPFKPGQIPNGFTNNCSNCHFNAGGGGARNDFGTLVETRFLSEPGEACNVLWVPLLASLDADYDGITNGVELQDPFGQWASGQPAPQIQ
ncbi:MAG: hypothetical protein ABIJ40_18415 [Bacteroidota bacterium]